MNKAMVKNSVTGKWEDRSVELLHGLTVAHYTKLGFYDHATALKQKCYALTEAGETTKAVLVNDLPEIKDGIGDILVCVINWAQIEGFDFAGRVKNIGNLGGSFDSDDLSIEIHNILSDLAYENDISYLLRNLGRLAKNYDLTLADCLGCAYDVVIKRRVKPLNGTLVKEANWHKHPELEGVEPL